MKNRRRAYERARERELKRTEARIRRAVATAEMPIVRKRIGTTRELMCSVLVPCYEMDAIANHGASTVDGVAIERLSKSFANSLLSDFGRVADVDVRYSEGVGAIYTARIKVVVEE